MASLPPRHGAVVSFDPDEGLGLLRSDDGDEYPFHCTRIADGTRIVEQGTASQIMSAPQTDYARNLVAATPRVDAPIPTETGEHA